jgi:hypothetical protein
MPERKKGLDGAYQLAVSFRDALDNYMSRSFDLSDSPFFDAFGNAIGEREVGDDFDLIRLSSGAGAADSGQDARGPDETARAYFVEARPTGVGPETGVPLTGGYAEFQDLLNQRLAAMAEGGV